MITYTSQTCWEESTSSCMQSINTMPGTRQVPREEELLYVEWTIRDKGGRLHRRQQTGKGREERLAREAPRDSCLARFALATLQAALQRTRSEGDFRLSAGWPLMLHSSCQQLSLRELVPGFHGFHSHFLLHFLLVFWRNSNLVEITVSYRLRVKLSKKSYGRTTVNQEKEDKENLPALQLCHVRFSLLN